MYVLFLRNILIIAFVPKIRNFLYYSGDGPNAIGKCRCIRQNFVFINQNENFYIQTAPYTRILFDIYEKNPVWLLV